MWGSMLDDLAKKAGEAAEAASGLAADATTQLSEQTAEGGGLGVYGKRRS